MKSRYKIIALTVVVHAFASEAFSQDSAVAPSGGYWLWNFLGRFHPAIVHFPIGLLYIALLFEFLGRRKRSLQYASSIRLTVAIAAGSAVVAVIMGLMLSNSGDYSADALQLHQWTGIATMVLSIFTAILYHKNLRQYAYLLLIGSTLGVTLSGHFGAELTHGEDYLTSALPGNSEQPDLTAGPQYSFASMKGPLTEPQIKELNLQVRSIFAHNCYSCHGQAKQKGDLRLDSKAAIFKGGKNGSILIPGNPSKSELVRRLHLPKSDKEAMPSKGKRLSANDIAIIEFWIKQGAPWSSGPDKGLFKVAAMAPRLPQLPPATRGMENPVDRFVNVYFEKNDIDWAKPVNDRLFIRRAYLDVIGLLPPPDSIDAFINDRSAGKRNALITSLLARNHDYAQHWLSFWNDALRNDYSGTGYITGGRFDITKWLYNSLVDNKPYNQFVKELINPDSSSQGFVKGIQWRGTINSSQSTEMQAAQNVSQVFLGLNLKCASCHDSFVSDWKLDDAYAFANLFSDSALEINRCDKPTGKMAERRMLFRELGTIDPKANRKERLRQLADIMVQPSDGRLYRTLVNRIWAQLFGRGLIEPVDVMDNNPWNQDLLDWLSYEFVNSGYDVKKLLAILLTSNAYQLPSVALKEPGMITDAGFKFKGMVRKRLTAEQFSDAVSESLHPVYPDSLIVFNLLPGTVKLNIPFARAALMKNDPFQTALGRPNRETVSTSRSSQANLLQALEVTNGTAFNETMKKAATEWIRKYPDASTLVKAVYRNALGRLPDNSEESVAVKALSPSPTEASVQDFLWAIAMHPEFQLIY
ncbi:MAG TPA: DUF1549 domain-containing protein [Flavitalea sp.]|nr:DUF1549 domain-containing protein [Flavitalea sp.]